MLTAAGRRVVDFGGGATIEFHLLIFGGPVHLLNMLTGMSSIEWTTKISERKARRRGKKSDAVSASFGGGGGKFWKLCRCQSFGTAAEVKKKRRE